MTTPLYYNNSYLMEFDSVIKSTSSNSEVVLAETCFYPEGGGQPTDTGILEINGLSHKVISVRAIGDIIYHRLDPTLCGDFTGLPVHGKLDEDRRHYHMRNHTALHLLNSFMLREFGVMVTGGKVGSPGESSRHDFELDRGLTPEERNRMEVWINQIIGEDRPVITRLFTDEEAKNISGFCRTRNVEIRRNSQGIRGVEIVGVDIQACGGTHVNRTGELGHFRVQKIDNKGANLRRVKIMLS